MRTAHILNKTDEWIIAGYCLVIAKHEHPTGPTFDLETFNGIVRDVPVERLANADGIEDGGYICHGCPETDCSKLCLPVRGDRETSINELETLALKSAGLIQE